jgi:hypothetical protein
MGKHSFYRTYWKNDEARYDDHDDHDDHDRYDDDDDADRHNDHDDDDTILAGGVTYTETADDVYVSANGDTIVEADHGSNDHDDDDTILAGGVTYTETADDVYVSANGDTIVEAPVAQPQSYDDDMLLEALSAISSSSLKQDTFVVRFETDKQLNTVGVGVDYEDFYSVIHHIVGITTLAGNSAIAADVDGNGNIDIQDAIGILQMMSGSRDSNSFALIGAHDITTAEIVMIGDVNNSLQYVDLVV